MLFMKHVAMIDEIFSSIQGEGHWIGQRQLFVRFAGCDIQCRYCDTPAARRSRSEKSTAAECRIYPNPSSSAFERILNPLSVEQLSSLCFGLEPAMQSRPVLSLTGGEPLLHHVFLSEWLPQVRRRFLIYLETSGIHAEAVQELSELVDVVSMDIKLPSATGLRAYWDEHRRFLAAVKGRHVYLKAVVTADSAPEDIESACRIIAEVDSTLLFILQPADGPLAPPSGKLIAFQDRALGIINDVRIIPQAHKMLQLR